MKRTGPARPFALCFSLLVLSACSSPRTAAQRTIPPPPAGIAPASENPPETPGPDTASAGAVPFPEVTDTLSWELPDTSPADAFPDSNAARPPDTLPTAAARPDGIRQKPWPKELPTRVHVFLNRSAKPVALYSLGDVQILAEKTVEGDAGKILTVLKTATVKGRFSLRAVNGGFSLEQPNKPAQNITARKVRLIPLNPFNLIDVGGAVYRGSLHLISGDKGEITTVNVLPVEDYLRGVLPYELGTVDREALEALKAQAIVARTYAFKRMLRAGPNADFHINSDVSDQVYKGVRGEYLLSDRAVRETRGMAVTHGDSLAICYYFSTCSGRTASKHEVWGGDSIPYLVSRPDLDALGEPYCFASKYSAWTQEWGQSQLAGIVRRNLRSAGAADAPSFSTLKSIDVSDRASCGRIRTMKIQTDRGPILIKGDKVRWALRPGSPEDKILPSAFFNVKISGGKVTAQGRGFGHGVGLCQVGAIGRARAGQNFRQIIDAYYTGVQVVEFK